ncbi:MAG: HAD family phosphatase [Chloroflexi bacterium]|nr:HAD family phosphatase [Chloroflexota bacterium]
MSRARFSIIASDLDGTLLTPDHRMPDGITSRLQAAQDLGVTVVLCSARQPQPIIVYRDSAGLRAPIIAYSGALIMDDRGGELAYWPVTDEAAAQAISTTRALADREHISVYVYVGDRWYVEAIDERVQVEAAANPGTSPMLTDDLLREIRAGGGFAKTMLVGPHELLESVRLALNERLGSMIVCIPSQATHYEILSHDVSKGAALSWLAERLGVPRDRILAIGDNYNDLPMFDAAGTSVAVANAPEAVRARADYVVPSNIDEGAALAIDRLVLDPNGPNGELTRTAG